MATLLPTSQSTSVEAYEDMFKEITRKLYGEESTHGLYPHNTQVAQLASNAGPTIPEGERSFTTLVSDRSLAQLDYDNAVDSTFKTEDHLSTAFGLAALMQNGFPPPGAILNPVNFNMSNNSTKQHNTSNVTQADDRWPQADDILSWNSNKMPSYTAPQKFLKVKPKQEPGVVSDSNNSMVNNNNVSAASNKQPQSSASLQSLTNPTPKRYTCSSCPYSTDRRDLFTRHENIHKEEKPFHCYACLKQYNRADHVKKHFVRMHRELTYDINKTRRNPPKNHFYASSNNNQQQQQTQSNGLGQQSTQSISQSTANNQSSTTNSTLNIPPSFNNQSLQLTGLQATQLMDQQGVAVASGLNGVTITPSQQLPNNVTIKQEKTEKAPKKRGEKRFMCCYCSWSGSDNWGLKRHMNTHTKPYVCLLCDYKAARSERLTTHVLKVHNKKACNKCSFFADDQNQLAAHQLEAHPHEQRPSGRNNTNNNNQSVTNNTTNVTNNAVNSTNNGSSATNTNNLSTGGSGNINNSNAGNVLRSLQNAFVPSATSLNTIQNSAVFGSISSSTIYNNNATNNSTNNLLNNLNNQANNWRNNLISVTLTPGNGGATTSSNGGSGQKHGAERLFAYLEADGSDPEDYNRQVAMQALSRNTASVAQDFHNAGGGNEDQPQQMSLLEVITSRLQSYKNSTTTSSSGTSSEGLNAATSPSQCSPPASSLLLTNHQHHTQTGKRRRRRPTQLQPLNNVVDHNDDHDNWASKEAVMDNLYRQSINTYINQLQYAEVDDELKITLADFLENNPDISITQIDWDKTVGKKTPTKTQPKPQPETVTEKRNNRKQVQPRKIEKHETFSVAALREKHLERMVAPGLICRLCKQRDLFDSYHTVVSLMLHKRWRHARTFLNCKTCGDQFNKKYKLILHQRLKHKH